MKKKIKFFESCRVVKGANQSVICDLQRFNYTTIPNDLVRIIEVIDDGKTVDEIQLAFNHEYDEIIEEYISFLILNEFAFYTNTPHFYPKMSMDWFYPFDLNNAIIELTDTTNYEKIIHELNDLKCKNVEFRYYDNNLDTTKIYEIIQLINREDLIISNMIFVLPYHIEIGIDIDKMISLSSRVLSFIIYNSKQTYYEEVKNHKKNIVYYTKKSIVSNKNCGCFSKSDFVINMELFTESHHHNTCLNKKISIDKDGEIRNCPSMLQSFGNIENTSLLSALNHLEFKRFWNITKDQISSCKDCEFRHICTDCRAFIEEPNNEFSKPLKCGYDPYTGIWDEWSTNPLKQNAIEFYGLRELLK